MTLPISYIALAFVIGIAVAMALVLVTKKRNKTTPAQSDVVNDTSYNIDGIEADRGEGDVKEYLDRKHNSDAQPLNRRDFEKYQQKNS